MTLVFVSINMEFTHDLLRDHGWIFWDLMLDCLTSMKPKIRLKLPTYIIL